MDVLYLQFVLGSLYRHQLSTPTRNTQFPRLHHSRLKDHPPPSLPPHLSPQRLSRQHDPGKPNLDVPETAICLEDMPSREPKEARTVQDRRREPSAGAELWVDVHGHSVTAESVQRRLLLRGLLLDHGVWSSLWGGMRQGRSSRAVRANGSCGPGITAPAEPTRPSDEEREFVVEDVLMRAGVSGGESRDRYGCVALVDDIEESRRRGQRGCSGDGVSPDLQVVLPVEHLGDVEVGDDFRVARDRRGAQQWDEAEGGHDLEIGRALVD